MDLLQCFRIDRILYCGRHSVRFSCSMPSVWEFIFEARVSFLIFIPSVKNISTIDSRTAGTVTWSSFDTRLHISPVSRSLPRECWWTVTSTSPRVLRVDNVCCARLRELRVRFDIGLSNHKETGRWLPRCYFVDWTFWGCWCTQKINT